MTQSVKSDFVLIDAIASEAYLTTMVTCLVCEDDLLANDINIEQPNDPMEVWAEKFSSAAKKHGWSVSSTGSILCPNCND